MPRVQVMWSGHVARSRGKVKWPGYVFWYINKGGTATYHVARSSAHVTWPGHLTRVCCEVTWPGHLFWYIHSGTVAAATSISLFSIVIIGDFVSLSKIYHFLFLVTLALPFSKLLCNHFRFPNIRSE